MTKTIKIMAPIILLIILIFTIPSCGQKVSEEDYAKVMNELSDARKQIEILQKELIKAEMMEVQYQEQYEALSQEFEELKIQNEFSISEMEIMESIYEEMKAEYKDMKRQLDELLTQ